MISTRNEIKRNASEAILEGLAPDGGLYVFESIKPIFSEDFLSLTYTETALKIMQELLPEFNNIKEMIEQAYNKHSFPDQIVDVVDNEKYAYLSLYKGETLSFKDMALSILPYLVKESKKINNDTSKLVILTATSGDTGSASLAGFSKIGADVIVLYPNQGVSDFQEKQMLHFKSEKNRVYAINGNFDDAQTSVKEVFGSYEGKLNVSSANSINIGRIIPQIVYYFYSYASLVNKERIQLGEKINYIVPTGNFGNIYAGFIAKELGLPIQQLVIASNENNNLTKLFHEGIYDISNELKRTITPSMDIVISSNLERYLYSLLGAKRLREVMNELREKKVAHIPEILSQGDFIADFVNEGKTIEAIKKESRVIDPHTAVAKAVYDKGEIEGYSVIVSTASPLKFNETMLQALDIKENELQLQMNKDYDSRVEQYQTSSQREILSNPVEQINNLLKEIENEN